MEKTKGKKLKRGLHTAFDILLLCVFLFSAVKLFGFYRRYQNSRNAQQEAVAAYTRPSSALAETGAGSAPAETGTGPAPDGEPETPKQRVLAPIEVDFARLLQDGPDVVGWLYCEGSVINYPVVYGRDNAFYLEHDFRGVYDPSGAIFTDMYNENGFSDRNVILYGHHIADRTMFGSLRDWLDPAYCEAHPVMWLLTPERDYRLEIFAGYITSSDSETYTVFREGDPGFGAYLDWVNRWSEIHPEVALDPEGQYIVLSTCDYSFEEARTVLHGILLPADSAGGRPLDRAE